MPKKEPQQNTRSSCDRQIKIMHVVYIIDTLPNDNLSRDIIVCLCRVENFKIDSTQFEQITTYKISIVQFDASHTHTLSLIQKK